MPVHPLRLLLPGLLLVTGVSAVAPARAAGWDDPANYLFAARSGGDVVTVIDLSQDQVVGRITTEYPIDDIAVSGFGDYAFASHADQKKITVISLPGEKIEAVTPVSIKPRHLTFEQNSGVVMTDSLEGGMAMLDGTGRREIFANPEIPPSRDVIFGPTGIVAYFYSGTAGIVGAVAMNDGRALWQSQVPKSEQSTPLVRSLDGLFIVVTIAETGEMQALMSADGHRVGNLHLGKGLSRPYVTANGQYFLVTEQTNKQVHVLSQSNFNKLISINTNQPAHLVTSGLFDVMSVAFADSSLYAMDLLKLTPEIAHELPVRGPASDAIVTSDTRHVYAAIPSANAIAHLDLRSGELSYIDTAQAANIVSIGVSNAVCH